MHKNHASTTFTPKVNPQNEFLQIANDFSQPLEIVREALSNAYDSGASEFSFEVTYDNSSSNLIIEMRDNGCGMSYDTLKENFWDLGNSASAKDPNKIGEKGHGTKIYLLSKRVYVMTSDGYGTVEAECLFPQDKLHAGKMHEVSISEVERDESLLPSIPGTYIRVEGYNGNETKTFHHEVVEDYSYWFTKLGSFEEQFPNNTKPDFAMRLKGLGSSSSKILSFGHPFPEEEYDIDKLREKHGQDAADYFVKRYVFPSETLEDFPEVSFDFVAYVEGDKAKRQYNGMLRDRAHNGHYKVSDRYGLWLSKDYIPVERKNGWVTNFGTGSNSYVMLHGFVNCQQLRLTANRGTVSNTDPNLIDALQMRIGEILSTISEDAYKKNGLGQLKEITEAEKVNEQERKGYEERIKRVQSRKYYDCGDSLRYYEPANEAELSSMFTQYYAFHPDDFLFEPVDYVTNVGIDILAKDKTGANPADTEYWFVELKKTLSKVQFNHSFGNIRYILCWDIEDAIEEGHVFHSKLNESRELKLYPQDNGKTIYRLVDSSGITATSIQIIQLKSLIEEKAAAQEEKK